MRRRSLALALFAVTGVVAICGSIAMAQERSGRAIDTHALFRAVGYMYDLDPQLLEAIASVESSYDADAVSPKGAQGLMQLMPDTARRFRVDDSFDPVENALGAARFLDYLRRSLAATPDLGFHLTELIAAYNAGEGAVAQYHGVPPYPETQQYVRRVLVAYLLGEAPSELRARLANARPNTSAAAVRIKTSTPASDGASGALQEMAEIRAQRTTALQRSTNLPPAERPK